MGHYCHFGEMFVALLIWAHISHDVGNICHTSICSRTCEHRLDIIWTYVYCVNLVQNDQAIKSRNSVFSWLNYLCNYIDWCIK